MGAGLVSFFFSVIPPSVIPFAICPPLAFLARGDRVAPELLLRAGGYPKGEPQSPLVDPPTLFKLRRTNGVARGAEVPLLEAGRRNTGQGCQGLEGP